VILELGGDVHARTIVPGHVSAETLAADAVTPLPMAAAGGHVETVSLLLKLGVTMGCV
jgi:hypothetical protein